MSRNGAAIEALESEVVKLRLQIEEINNKLSVITEILELSARTNQGDPPVGTGGGVG